MPFVTRGEIFISPVVASPLLGKIPFPIFPHHGIGPLSQALIQEKALRIFEKLKEESEENVTIEFLASRG